MTAEFDCFLDTRPIFISQRGTVARHLVTELGGQIDIASWRALWHRVKSGDILAKTEINRYLASNKVFSYWETSGSNQ